MIEGQEVQIIGVEGFTFGEAAVGLTAIVVEPLDGDTVGILFKDIPYDDEIPDKDFKIDTVYNMRDLPWYYYVWNLKVVGE